MTRKTGEVRSAICTIVSNNYLAQARTLATVQRQLSPERVGPIILGRLQQIAHLDQATSHRRAA